MEIVARLRAAGCVFAEDEAALLAAAARDAAELESMVRRRVSGEPIEYIVGWAEFRGRRYAIEAGVFVPRHRSELLVEQAIVLATPGAVVLDLCCGCGALGLAVQQHVPVELHAADIDPVALRCARRNGVGAVHAGDLFQAVPATLRGRIAVLLVNAPYVPTAAIEFLPAEFRDHEAPAALDGGPDGTDVQRRVLREAAHWLAPGATLLTETSERQAPRLVEVAHAHGLQAHPVTDTGSETTLVLARRRPENRPEQKAPDIS